MLIRRRLTFWFLILFRMVVPAALFSQAETATLSGRISDPQGSSVPKAQVEIVNIDTNIISTTSTNEEGIYVFSGIRPGRYRLLVLKDGFHEIIKPEFVLNVQDHIEQNFGLQVGSVSESVTVEAGGLNINTTDASVSTIVDRKFVENIPLNGRSFQSLILLAPGITAVPGASVNSTGEFSVNGQRTQANYFTVDGVSANTGASPQQSGFTRSNGGTAAETALGTTQSLVSVDALQEFRITTSTYSAEFGRTPGAQVSFQTRSGTNDWHGSLFDYFRNEVLDANNWFNNSAGLARTAERQNDFGGTLGGPVKIPRTYKGKDRTFFFFSYEGLRLTVPQPAFTTEVPDTFLRENSTAALQPFLNAFPIQNGPDDPNCLPPGPPTASATCLASFTGTYSAPSSLDSYSIRLDHTFGDKLRVFGRYSDSPSYATSRDVADDPAILVNFTSHVRSATVGTTSIFSSRFANEFRFNYTKNESAQTFSTDNFGGAIPIGTAKLFPGVNPQEGYTFNGALNFGTGPTLDVNQSRTPQHQWNLTDSIVSTIASHTLKYGVDYRRLASTSAIFLLVDELFYSSPAEVLSNTADIGIVESFGAPKVGVFTNFSAFVQDEWRVSSRTHVSLGLRWDFNPPPRDGNGPQPYTLDQVTDLTTAKLAPAGTPTWQTDYRGFAPRIGLAYEIRKAAGHETVLRTGFGVFYDVGNSVGLAGLGNAVGFASNATFPAASFPLTSQQNALPPPSTASPYNATVMAFDPQLRLPYTLQWNVAVEQGLGANQTLTVSYVAADGRKLLSQRVYLPSGNPNFALGHGLTLTTNGSSSNYNSLQVQYQRRLSHGLQALGSYTYSHAIDDLSNQQLLNSPPIRGNADFDLRHNFSAALTYDVPGNYSNSLSSALLKHWGFDLRQTARAGLPVTIFSGFGHLPSGQRTFTTPNLLPGIPVYLSDPTAPGGRVVNINAFSQASGPIGDAPRNFVRGFGALQTDVAIRREFPLYERMKLQFRAEAFNVFNHPNFGAINNFLSEGPTLFGRANGTLNNFLGGLDPLYQTGGPRSIQLALKLIF